MDKLSDRIAGLPEAKRKLLAQLLNEQSPPRPAPPLVPPPTPFGRPAAAVPAAVLEEPQPGTSTGVKAAYRRFYDAVTTQLDATIFGQVSFFLNYGYRPNHHPSFAPIEVPQHYINKNSVRLVLELIGDCPLTGRRVLDVGCGRGGTVHVVKTMFDANTITGLDLSPQAIRFCKQAHGGRQVSFCEGDAENLPFDDGAFDVVTNVESSHSYPDIGAFYANVFRVLSPGGSFLYTDVQPVAQLEHNLGLLRRVGFVVERDTDITSNVLLSCDEIARTRVQAFSPDNDPALMRNFLATPESQVYDEMKTGRWQYRIFRLKKPSSGPGTVQATTVQHPADAEAESVADRTSGRETEKPKLPEEAPRRNTPPAARAIARRQRSDMAPLSDGQWRIWMLDQLAQGGSFYNESTTMPLSFAVDVPVLERAVNEIVRRHESLRTTFDSVDGQPVQRIAASLFVPLPVDDLRDLPWHQRDDEVRRLTREQARQPFDLAHGPLIRTGLIRLDEKNHLFFATFHHIVYDGWSMGVFAWELTTLYHAYVNGVPPQLPELPIQYADFAVWQHETLQSAAVEQQLSYWKEHLAGLSVLQLPTDRPRPALQTFDGARHAIVIPESLCDALNAVCQREGASLFMGLLAAFQTLLHRYSGQDDIAVGAPVAYRHRTELEGLIGFLVNTLVMRTDFSGNPTFRVLLRRVRDVAMRAYSHQDVPFERLVQELQPARDPSRTPLFQVTFQLFNAPSTTFVPPSQIPALTAVDSGHVKFDLRFDLLQAAHGLQGYLDYNTDLFDAETIARMAAHFNTLLSGIAADPDRCLSELPLLTDAERERVLVTWNRTEADYPRHTCIHEQFEAQVERTPDAPAVVSDSVQLTYAELNRRANQLAHHLAANGIGPGVFGAVCLERSVDLVVACLAILKAGGAYVPMDPSYPPARLRFMLDDVQAPVLVTRRVRSDTFLGAPSTIFCVDSDWDAAAQESVANPESDVTPDDLAYVIYTSGSTGQPKGVEIRHVSLMNLVTWHQRHYEVTPADRASQVAAPAFDAAAWELWPYLAAGASVHVPEEGVVSDAAAMVEWLTTRAITIAFLPTLLAESVIQRPWPTDSSLRKLLTGGDALHSGVPGTLPFELSNHYGPTENTVVTTRAPVSASRQGQAAPPIGRPISNVKVYVLDRHRQPVPVGVPGELCISGDGLARGYHNRPALTAEKFIEHPFAAAAGSRLYRTGDLVRHRSSGDLEFLGRIDQQVKIRGFRVELGEIEVVLRQAPGVKQCVVLAHDDSARGKSLVAYVEPIEGTGADAAALRRFLQQQLPDYLVPPAFVFLDTLPVTASGKIDRQALLVPGIAEREREKYHVPPGTPLEEVLANIWSEVLHLERIGVNDDFFELGGHSLLATQLASRLRDTFKVELPLRTLFEAVTIAELAQAMVADPLTRARVERTAQLLLAVSELSEDEVQVRLTDRSRPNA